MPEIPNNKPTAAVNWASGGGATRTEPGVAKRDQGWTFSEQPPFDFFNQIQGVSGDYLAWLADNAVRTFDDFYSAVTGEDPAPTDPVPVAPSQFFKFERTAGQGIPFGGPDPLPLQGFDTARALLHDGSRLYVLDEANNEIRALPSDPTILAAPPYANLWTVAGPSAGTPLSFDTDGAVVAVGTTDSGADPEIKIYDAVDGSLLAELDNGEDVPSIYCDSDLGTRRVYFASGDDIFVWVEGVGFSSYYSGAGRILAVTTTPRGVIWAEADIGASPTGVTIYRDSKQSPGSQIAIAANPIASKAGVAKLVHDGEHLYVGWYSNTTNQPIIARLPLGGPALNYLLGGSPFWAVELPEIYSPATIQGALEVDDKYLYCAGDTEAYALDKRTGAIRHTFSVSAGMINTDGVNLWLADRLTNTQVRFATLDRGTSLWRRVGNGASGAAPGAGTDGGSSRKPFRKTALPLST